MAEALKPSFVLKEYDIVGRKIPVSLINKMRGRFAELEIEGVGIWKILCDEITDLDAEKKIDQDRLYVAQACAEVLLQKSGTTRTARNLDGISWKNRVRQLLNGDEFVRLFMLMNLSDTEWQNTWWLAENGYTSLVRTIRNDPRFDTWKDFLVFTEVDRKESMIDRVGNCKKKIDFTKLFIELGIGGDEWINSNWLRENGYKNLYNAISNDPRFDSWEDFLKYMNIEKQTWVARVSRSIKREDFIRNIRAAGIEGDEWQNTVWLEKNGHLGFFHAVRRDVRFNKWNDFLGFMNVESNTYVARVARCKSKEDFIKLFRESGVKGGEWHSSHWLIKNELQALYGAIYYNGRFDTWNDFLVFMDIETELEDEEMEQLAELSSEDAIALLGNDRLKLKLYLTFAHPELTEEEVDTLVIRSFKGLRTRSSDTKEAEYLEYSCKLADPVFTESPYKETDEASILLEGVVADADACYISGCWNRRVAVTEDGSFSVRVPLEIGATNEICVMGIDRKNSRRSEQYYYEVEQTDDPEDIEALFLLLSEMRQSAVQEIQQDPGRFEFLVNCAEQMLVKKFTNSFEEGEDYVAELIVRSTSPFVRRMLRRVLANFRRINRQKDPNINEDTPLYFFQKYCWYAICKRIDAGEPGVVLGNDPGTGKTAIAWATVNSDDAVIVTPNSVVSSFAEEAGKFLKHSDALVLQGIAYGKRKEMLEVCTQRHRITNVEYLRHGEDQERLDLLSDENTIVVQDEAHSVANLNSQQTIGLLALRRKFLLLMTATPAKNVLKARRLLHVIYPDDPRFQNDKVCLKAFPQDDPKAMQEFNLIFRKVLIRFRAQDVMEEFDRSRPLQEQKNRLPHKEYIEPEGTSEFTLTEKQSQAIYELFLNWDKWTRKYGKYLPDDSISRMDNLRRGQGFTKKHALRQIVNNPAYIGENTRRDPKADRLKSIVRQNIEGEGRPVVLFCQYNAQAIKYQELFKKYNPALYTGTTSEKGWHKDESGKPTSFKTHPEGGWLLDQQGQPIPDEAEGSKMLAMDHERIAFQNNPDCRMIICTYSAGAVGVTFTKGKASIEDDLPEDCVADIQSEYRTCRIDHEHLTHYDINHYSMISRYSPRFLGRMKKCWVRRLDDGTYEEVRSKKVAEKECLPSAYDEFFAQGTYDQVHFGNLGVQRTIFHLVNDGIADDSLLEENKMTIPGIDM